MPLPILTISAGINHPYRLLCDGQPVEEFDTAEEASAALLAACGAAVSLGLIFHTANQERA